MTSKQPEALRIADELEEPITYFPQPTKLEAEAAAELRRQHAENETLRAGYDAARLEIESLRAQGAEPAGAQHPMGKHQRSQRLPTRTARPSCTSATAPSRAGTAPTVRCTKSDKQRARDAYAAGMGDSLVMAGPTAVAGPSETVKFTDQSTANPVEKARRYLTAMGSNHLHSSYFFDDGYPKQESATDALATLAVLEQLAAAPTTQPAPKQDPSQTAVQLAELVLSDCGHSSRYAPLLNRVTARINAHVERRLDELRGCLESRPSPASQEDAKDAARYHYLRDVPMERWPAELLTAIRLQQNAKWDAAIDAARAAQEDK